MEKRYKTYNQKCKCFALRFRTGKDDKYINFLKECPNRTEFIRRAIDRELNK